MSPRTDKKEADGEKEDNCAKKVAELEASLIEKTKLEETYLNQIKYARADLENLQKHVQRRIDEGVTREKEKIIIQLLPVAEDLDLLLEGARRTGESTLIEGIEMVNKKFWKVLNCEGLCPIEAVGKPFDPNMHEAVMEVETCDHHDRTVIQEVRKGYLLKGKVLKPTMVNVAHNPNTIKSER